jgi:ribosomal subunit interface protein
MVIHVTLRNKEIPSEVKDIAYEKSEKLNRYFDHISRIEVIFSFDGKRDYKVEIIAAGPKHHNLVTAVKNNDALAAFDKALDKMERQLTKMKEKMKDHHSKIIKSKNKESDDFFSDEINI